MREVKIDANNPAPEAIAEVAHIVREGGVVVIPTDTVYGLAGRLDDAQVVERIFAAKERPPGKGLIAMIADDRDVAGISAGVTPVGQKLISRFWPGPVTLVLPAARNIPTKALVNGKIGVRLPDHRMLRDLIRAVGVPLATTSANLSGRPSSTDVAQCRADLGDRVDLIIDGGPCALGVESSVVDVTVDPPLVIRAGIITTDVLAEVLVRDEN